LNVAIFPFELASPSDGRGVRAALRRLPLREVLQLAVIAKIEGTATLDDASREVASQSIRGELEHAGGAALLRRSLQILSVGCEGVITPGGWLVASLRGRSSATGLAIGCARGEPVAMRDRATRRHIRAAADAVRSAMRRAGLDRKSVELVLIKSPIRMPGGSTGASRGAAALGAALALGEIRDSDLDEKSLYADWTLYSSKTMAFSGTETERCEAIVMGNRRGGDPALRIDRAVLADILDTARLAALGSGAEIVFYKAGITRDGLIRGLRTTVMTSELPADKQLRAAASGVVGAAFGTTRVFISGGAEHQGRPGACLAAVIRSARR